MTVLAERVEAGARVEPGAPGTPAWDPVGHAAASRKPWPQEGSVTVRTRPAPKAPAADPLAAWPEQRLTPDAHGRLLTVFNNGSCLTWRLPALSASIDARTIFPDSAATPEGYHLPVDGPMPTGPWRSADVAFVPLAYPVAAALDSSPEWRRVATVPRPSGDNIATGLWVRATWWARAAHVPLSTSPVALPSGPKWP
jgi:hypothetical protein